MKVLLDLSRQSQHTAYHGTHAEHSPQKCYSTDSALLPKMSVMATILRLPYTRL